MAKKIKCGSKRKHKFVDALVILMTDTYTIAKVNDTLRKVVVDDQSYKIKMYAEYGLHVRLARTPAARQSLASTAMEVRDVTTWQKIIEYASSERHMEANRCTQFGTTPHVPKWNFVVTKGARRVRFTYYFTKTQEMAQ